VLSKPSKQFRCHHRIWVSVRQRQRQL